jgi:hypothetical protein
MNAEIKQYYEDLIVELGEKFDIVNTVGENDNKKNRAARNQYSAELVNIKNAVVKMRGTVLTTSTSASSKQGGGSNSGETYDGTTDQYITQQINAHVAGESNGVKTRWENNKGYFDVPIPNTKEVLTVSYKRK